MLAGLQADRAEHGSATDLVPSIARPIADREGPHRVTARTLEIARGASDGGPNGQDLAEHVDACLGRDLLCFVDRRGGVGVATGTPLGICEMRQDLVSSRLVTLFPVPLELGPERHASAVEV